jgi:peptidoglycan/xylan/chitin deacetylase (PgdA/CDA1 family)
MFRFDRALTIAVHRVSRLHGGHRKPRIPILMYHGIRDGIGKRRPYFETNTSPTLFARHMQFLRDNGYRTLDLTDALESMTLGHGQRCVALTFDDGYRDFYTQAFPILAQHGFIATMFIISGLTAERTTLRDDKEFMTWNEVREIHSYGIRIGSHTATHPELHPLSPQRVAEEVGQSKRSIEDALGEPVRSFSYPFAFPEQDKRFVGMLRGQLGMCGYENGVSTIIGTASRDHDGFFLPRLPVNSYDDLAFFQAKLEGSYDWLHPAQILYKHLRKRSRAALSPGVATAC